MLSLVFERWLATLHYAWSIAEWQRQRQSRPALIDPPPDAFYIRVVAPARIECGRLRDAVAVLLIPGSESASQMRR